MNKELLEENDRNIRVFGMETQKKLFESEVLFMNITPMIGELCKNIILSGAGICLFDDGSKVENNEITDNFFFNINDVGKNRTEILKDKIKTFKENCRITIIKDIQEIKNKNIKYCVVDLSGDFSNKNIKNDFQDIINSNKGIIYFIKIKKDKAIFFNNILEKKLLQENKDNNIRFTKDEKLTEFLDISDDDDDVEMNGKKNEEKKMEAILVNDDEEEKKEEILIDEDYEYLNIDNKIKEIKNLIPKKIKNFEEEIINNAFNVINDSINPPHDPLNCLCNYVLGGVVCHELVNCISRKKNPRTNIYFYDAFNGTGKFLNELYDKFIK